jgi:hypothetical protein
MSKWNNAAMLCTKRLFIRLRIPDACRISDSWRCNTCVQEKWLIKVFTCAKHLEEIDARESDETDYQYLELEKE